MQNVFPTFIILCTFIILNAYIGFCGYRKRLPRSLPSRSNSVRAVVQAKYVRTCAPPVRRTTAATASTADSVHSRHCSTGRHHSHVAEHAGRDTEQQSPRLLGRRFAGQQQRWPLERCPGTVVTVVGHPAVLSECRRRRSRRGHHVAKPHGRRIPGSSLR